MTIEEKLIAGCVTSEVIDHFGDIIDKHAIGLTECIAKLLAARKEVWNEEVRLADIDANRNDGVEILAKEYLKRSKNMERFLICFTEIYNNYFENQLISLQTDSDPLCELRSIDSASSKLLH